jgi:hypothetical protein
MAVASRLEMVAWMLEMEIAEEKFPNGPQNLTSIPCDKTYGALIRHQNKAYCLN